MIDLYNCINSTVSSFETNVSQGDYQVVTFCFNV